MKVMEVGLFEKIPPSWQEGGNLHHKLQKVREPWVLWPKRSHQCQLQTLGLSDLLQHPREETERREGINLEAVPTLKHGIGARRLMVHHRREIDRKPVIEERREEVDCGRPEAKKMTKPLHTGGPLGTNDLIPATQRVGEGIHLARDELGKELNVRLLAKPEDRLSHGVERGRVSAPVS